MASPLFWIYKTTVVKNATIPRDCQFLALNLNSSLSNSLKGSQNIVTRVTE